MTEETRCRVCGRVIRKEPWVERGIGPDCYAALRRKEAEEVKLRPSCYGAFGSEECNIVGCVFQDSCEVEETQSFEKAREAEV